MAGENRKCAIELLGHDEARESVGHGHGSQREQQLSAQTRDFGPSAGRANGEDNLLRALVAAFAEPCGKTFRSHLAATAIEQYSDGGRASFEALQPIEQRLLGAESFGLAMRECGTAAQISCGERFEFIPRGGARADVRQCEVHGGRISHRGGECTGFDAWGRLRPGVGVCLLKALELWD